MLPRVGEPSDVRGRNLLPIRLEPGNALQRWVLLPCRVQEHVAVPVWVLLRIVRPFQPDAVRCGELLSGRCVQRCGLCSGQLLSKGLHRPEIVQCRLLLPQRVGPAAVRGGLRVCERVGEPDDVRWRQLLPWPLEQWHAVQRRVLLPRWVQEHDAVPSGQPLRGIRPFQPNALRCGELLSGGRVKRGDLHSRQFLSGRFRCIHTLPGRELLCNACADCSVQ